MAKAKAKTQTVTEKQAAIRLAVADSFGTGRSGMLKNKLLLALTKTSGIVTSACEIAGCNRDTYRAYYNADPKFKAAVDDLRNVVDDFGESIFLELLAARSERVVIHFAKTRLQHRGYGLAIEPAESKWEAPPAPSIVFTPHSPS